MGFLELGLRARSGEEVGGITEGLGAGEIVGVLVVGKLMISGVHNST